MSTKALFTALFITAFSMNAFAQVTGGSTAGSTPGTTGTIPGTTGTIPVTTGTIPGTTQMPPAAADIPPATTPNISPTTELPPATTRLPGSTITQPPATTPLPGLTTQMPPATTGLPDFREDNTNITGRFGGNTRDDGRFGNDVIIFDNSAGVFENLDNDEQTLRGEFDSGIVILGDEEAFFGTEEEDSIFATPDTLDTGVFRDDRETPMD